jgi:hypothetical protein
MTANQKPDDDSTAPKDTMLCNACFERVAVDTTCSYCGAPLTQQQEEGDPNE